MESQEEFTGSNDHSTLIIKGKRTKRARPCSPLGVAGVTSSSSTGGDGCYFSVLSPMSSGEISTTTDEDEDMANCLILLARGVNSSPSRVAIEDEKLNSRRFAVKAGFDVYECKTCNRGFPSFQALGGHRASHKKPKAEKGLPPLQKPNHEVVEEDEPVMKFAQISQSLSSVQMANNNKPKVHECSICGSEFSSGQALGGHMRRHRAPPQTTIGQSTVTTDGKNMLSLDLNLPAPAEDDNHGSDDSNFQYLPSKERMVFSAAALVDCHY